MDGRQLIPGFLSEIIVQCVATFPESMGGGEFRSLVYEHLGGTWFLFPFDMTSVVFNKLCTLCQIPMSQAYPVPFTRTKIDFYSKES